MLLKSGRLQKYLSLTQKISKKVILENGEILEFIPDCYKTQKMYEKAVSYFLHASQYASNCYKSQICVIKQLILPILQRYGNLIHIVFQSSFNLFRK